MRRIAVKNFLEDFFDRHWLRPGTSDRKEKSTPGATPWPYELRLGAKRSVIGGALSKFVEGDRLFKIEKRRRSSYRRGRSWLTGFNLAVLDCLKRQQNAHPPPIHGTSGRGRACDFVASLRIQSRVERELQFAVTTFR
jgi:hypothetical protein